MTKFKCLKCRQDRKGCDRDRSKPDLFLEDCKRCVEIGVACGPDGLTPPRNPARNGTISIAEQTIEQNENAEMWSDNAQARTSKAIELAAQSAQQLVYEQDVPIYQGSNGSVRNPFEATSLVYPADNPYDMIADPTMQQDGDDWMNFGFAQPHSFPDVNHDLAAIWDPSTSTNGIKGAQGFDQQRHIDIGVVPDNIAAHDGESRASAGHVGQRDGRGGRRDCL